MAEIKYIPIKKLWDHPENPRKNLGDLTELTESIKANGILQNLTVVPKIGEITGKWDGETYTVVIGHRRKAAAKAAGLEVVPCVVTEMSHSEQIMTMLMENMQRTDLTVYEQAQSFQMMLDLGESVESIAKGSGFSETTVRRRIKLLDLDPEGFKASESRGATLADYMELDKLTDPMRKNEVLKTIGTANFRDTLRKEIEAEKVIAYLDRTKKTLESFATQIEKRNEINGESVPMGYIRSYGRWSTDFELKVPEDAETATYYYTVSKSCGYAEYTLYRLNDPDAEAAAPEETEEQRQARERREENDRRKKQLDQMSLRHFNLRCDFIERFSAVKKHLPTILHMAADAVIGDGGWRDDADPEIIGTILDIEFPEDADEMEMKEALAESMGTRPEKTLLAVAYSKLDSIHSDYYRVGWIGGMSQCIYEPNDELDRLYQHLTALGYQMSDEEKAMQDGSHELLQPVEAEENSEEAGNG